MKFSNIHPKSYVGSSYCVKLTKIIIHSALLPTSAPAHLPINPKFGIVLPFRQL